MPEDFGDLRHGSPVADHPSGQAVTEEVGGSAVRMVYLCPSERSAHNVADRSRACQTDTRRYNSQENPSRVTAATAVTQIERKRISDIRKQGHAVYKMALAMNDDLCRSPADVTELKHDYLSCT